MYSIVVITITPYKEFLKNAYNRENLLFFFFLGKHMTSPVTFDCFKCTF